MADKYVVAVRRDRREAARDWLYRLSRIRGVKVLGASDWRAQVEADDSGLARLTTQMGDDLLVEPTVERHRAQTVR